MISFLPSSVSIVVAICFTAPYSVLDPGSNCAIKNVMAQGLQGLDVISIGDRVHFGFPGEIAQFKIIYYWILLK